LGAVYVERMRRTQLLTHTDLDGIGCAVLVQGVVDNAAPALLVDNGSIDERVRTAIAERRTEPGRHRILITDHGVDGTTAALIEEWLGSGGELHLLDHHRSSDHLIDRAWATIDETHSATGLLYRYLGRPDRFADFAALVEDHDLWRHQDPRSQRLAMLAGLLGPQRFLARFVDRSDVEFTDGELLVLELEESRRESYLTRKAEQAILRDLRGVTWAICYAEAYQSEVSERLMTRFGAGATAVVNTNKRTVSLRGRTVDVAAIAQRQGGGGHARAAAFSFRGAPLELTLERFEEGLQDLLG
jgi:oligoribonuclease NrnB/cAMP/cGMP phosphodiesterase (DHH superfamily)